MSWSWSPWEKSRTRRDTAGLYWRGPLPVWHWEEAQAPWQGEFEALLKEPRPAPPPYRDANRLHRNSTGNAAAFGDDFGTAARRSTIAAEGAHDEINPAANAAARAKRARLAPSLEQTSRDQASQQGKSAAMPTGQTWLPAIDAAGARDQPKLNMWSFSRSPASPRQSKHTSRTAAHPGLDRSKTPGKRARVRPKVGIRHKRGTADLSVRPSQLAAGKGTRIIGSRSGRGRSTLAAVEDRV